MTVRYTRREVLHRGALALPALHFGFGSWAVLRASGDTEARANRFHRLRLATAADKLEEMRKFYKGVLNLPLVGENAGSLDFQMGHTQFRFDAESGGGAPFYHFAFNIPENKLESATAWLSRRVPLLENRLGRHVVYFDWLDAHSVYFRDPGGNLLEFIAHHALGNGRSGEFDVEDILYASEIGLVTEDVPAVSAELDSKLGLTNYLPQPGQALSDVFAPIGDPHGFFIVVKHRRKWLMTDDPAELHPVRAALHGPARGEVRLQGCDCELSITG
jgi:catechol-2,3-dioxygenase